MRRLAGSVWDFNFFFSFQQLVAFLCGLCGVFIYIVTRYGVTQYKLFGI